SLIYVLNSSLTIVKMQQSQYEGIGKYGNIHDNSIIYYHINLLKSRNKSELLLDSVYIYLQSIMSANRV